MGLQVPDGEMVAVSKEPFAVAEATEKTPGFGNVKAVVDHVMPFKHLAHVWTSASQSFDSYCDFQNSPPLETALDNYSWKLISIKQEQGVLAGETLSESRGKQMALN